MNRTRLRWAGVALLALLVLSFLWIGLPGGDQSTEDGSYWIRVAPAAAGDPGEVVDYDALSSEQRREFRRFRESDFERTTRPALVDLDVWYVRYEGTVYHVEVMVE